MKNRIRLGRPAATFLLAAATLAPAAAHAQTAMAGAESGKWQVTLDLYAFMPTIKTGVQFPDTSTTIDTRLTFGDILDHLKMTFMGAIGAHNGTWGVFTDALYMDLGGTGTKTRNFTVGRVTVPADANVSLDQKTWIWTMAGEYRLVSGPQWTVDLLGGFRMLNMEATLNYGFDALRQVAGTKDASGTNWDGIVGVKGRYAFGDRKEWFVPFYIDAGTGQSQFTWQGITGIGYRFHWGDALATWRYIDFNGKSDQAVQNLTSSGPVLGVSLRF